MALMSYGIGFWMAAACVQTTLLKCSMVAAIANVGFQIGSKHYDFTGNELDF